MPSQGRGRKWVARRAICIGAVIAILLTGGAGAAGGTELSNGLALPTVVRSGPPQPPETRPGPAILHAPPADAPQLQNRPGGPWRADPILVSGADAYREGEYLYQGFLFDDHGAAGVADPTDPITTRFAFASKAGTLTYPTDPAFAHNAADLVELRVRPIGNATALRATLNTLIDPERTAFTVAIGSSAAPRPWPAGAGVSSPAALFLTVHGSTAALVDAASMEVVAPAPLVTVDGPRRQYEVRIPHAAWDPGHGTVRLAAGVGLWDVAVGRYLAPGAVADADRPGGAAPSNATLFDLAFRFAEPVPDWSRIGLAHTIADAAVVVQADQPCFWRECSQAAALQDGDVSAFAVEVDFAKLARRETDEGRVPRAGAMTRILASSFAFGQGIDPTRACGRFPVTCDGMFVGNLQPYTLYMPERAVPAGGWGLTLLLHAATANHNQYLGSRHQAQFADRGAGSIVVTPLARDPQGDYTDASEADVFEVWADVARRYPLDPLRNAIAGYSMGGGGTYKLLERWPDLFARGFAAAALPFDEGFQGQWIRSLRNVALMTWIGAADEAASMDNQIAQAEALEAQGIDFTYDQFLTADHLTLATNDEYGPAAEFLGDHRAVRDPARVTYVVDGRSDFPRTGVVADHAYWLSGLVVRAPESDPAGRIDVRSEGFGVADPIAPGAVRSTGVLEGGNRGPMPYVRTQQVLPPPGPAAAVDRLVITAENLAAVTIDVRRARVSCRAGLEVRSDGPLRVDLPACGTTIMFDGGATCCADRRAVEDLDRVNG